MRPATLGYASAVFIVHTRARHWIPTACAILTLMSVGVLLVYDVAPRLFPANAHDALAALPLVLVALSYLIYQATRGASAKQWARGLLLALAFLFWAANQLCRDRGLSTLFNDIAIAAFVFDVFLVIIG